LESGTNRIPLWSPPHLAHRDTSTCTPTGSTAMPGPSVPCQPPPVISMIGSALAGHKPQQFQPSLGLRSGANSTIWWSPPQRTHPRTCISSFRGS
jgi:hypothetical protein